MLYNVLLFVHILAAIVWVGGAVTIDVLASRAVRSGDPVRIGTMSREAGFVGQRIIAPTSVVLLVMGLSMVAVNDAWTIGQAWIIIALVVFGLTFLAGILFFGPEARRLERPSPNGAPMTPRCTVASGGSLRSPVSAWSCSS
jgi:uncharacterized membrane protein